MLCSFHTLLSTTFHLQFAILVSMAPEAGSGSQATTSERDEEKKKHQEAGNPSMARTSQDETESYFDEPQVPAKYDVESAGATGQTLTRPAFGQSLRAQTTPGKLRRQGTARFRGVKRTTTGAQASNNPRDPFQYTFDPLSSDSDSSSAEDESTTQKKHLQEDAKEHEQRQKVNTKAKDQNVKDEERKGHSYSRFALGNDFFKTKGRVSKRDGRLKISMSQTANSGYVAKALGQSIQNHLNVPKRDKHRRRKSKAQHGGGDDGDADSIGSNTPRGIARPRLNIVIMVIGSRGDIQPFLQVGKILKHQYGHRVRIATHPTFRDFVEKDAGLEMFSVGGDPSELMAFVSLTFMFCLSGRSQCPILANVTLLFTSRWSRTLASSRTFKRSVKARFSVDVPPWRRCSTVSGELASRQPMIPRTKSTSSSWARNLPSLWMPSLPTRRRWRMCILRRSLECRCTLCSRSHIPRRLHSHTRSRTVSQCARARSMALLRYYGQDRCRE